MLCCAVWVFGSYRFRIATTGLHSNNRSNHCCNAKKTWCVLIEFMQCKNWNPYLIAGARGMGISIALPDGRSHNFTGNNFPVLAGKTPEIFFGFLSTLSSDENSQCNPAETAAYISEHPSVDANAAWT